MKQFLLHTITACILLLTPFSLAKAEYDFEVNGLYYRVLSLENLTCACVDKRNTYNTAIRSSYSGDIVIPSTVSFGERTFTVKEIDAYAFYWSDITSVKISGTVEIIRQGAFQSCEKLQRVEIENGVNFIEASTFKNCVNLKTVKLSNTIQEIGELAFYDCNALSCTIIIPSTCKVLGPRALPELGKFSVRIEDSQEPLTVNEYGLGLCGGKSIYIGRNLKFEYFLRDPANSNRVYEYKEIIIGDGVTIMPDFERNPYNKEPIDVLVIGKSVTSVPNFQKTDIKKIQVNAITPPKANGFAEMVYLNATLLVPDIAFANYKKADVWKKFWTIEKSNVLLPKEDLLKIIKLKNDSSLSKADLDCYCLDNSPKVGLTYINNPSNFITDAVYDKIESTPELLNQGIVITYKDSQIGLLSTKGKEILPCEYYSYYISKDFDLYNDGVFYLEKDGRKGAVDCNGKTVIPFKYTYIEPFVKYINDDQISIVSSGGLVGVVSRSGKDIIPLADYSIINYYKDDLFFILKDNKTGIFNATKKTYVLEPEYSWINLLKGTEILFFKDNNEKYGTITESGSIVINPEYDDFFALDKNLILARKDDKYGVINETGETIVPCEYVIDDYDMYRFVIYDDSDTIIGISGADNLGDYQLENINIENCEEGIKYPVATESGIRYLRLVFKYDWGG